MLPPKKTEHFDFKVPILFQAMTQMWLLDYDLYDCDYAPDVMCLEVCDEGWPKPYRFEPEL